MKPPSSCAILPPAINPIPIPTSQLVRYVDVAVPRWLLGARFTKSVLKAGNMVPNATPCERAIPM